MLLSPSGFVRAILSTHSAIHQHQQPNLLRMLRLIVPRLAGLCTTGSQRDAKSKSPQQHKDQEPDISSFHGDPSQRRQNYQSGERYEFALSAFERHAGAFKTLPRFSAVFKWCTGEDSNLRSSKERQIYSLLPLTTRPPVHSLPGLRNTTARPHYLPARATWPPSNPIARHPPAFRSRTPR
jgi:hypothetical protein